LAVYVITIFQIKFFFLNSHNLFADYAAKNFKINYNIIFTGSMAVHF